MSTPNSTTAPSPTRDLVITRIFDAPRELVWQAWTQPEHFMRWWGPEYFTSPAAKMDVRVGGKYLYCMRSPAGFPDEQSTGMDFWSTGVYKEVVPMERLVYTDSFADADGNVVPVTYYGMPENYPSETTVVVTFEDVGGKTRMTLTQPGIPADDSFEQTEAGWNGSFDKLAATLV